MGRKRPEFWPEIDSEQELSASWLREALAGPLGLDDPAIGRLSRATVIIATSYKSGGREVIFGRDFQDTPGHWTQRQRPLIVVYNSADDLQFLRQLVGKIKGAEGGQT